MQLFRDSETGAKTKGFPSRTGFALTGISSILPVMISIYKYRGGGGGGGRGRG